MDVKFPLFIRDTDSYMCLLSSEKDINYHLERIDVEDEEYEGWDFEGKRIELYIEDDIIKARLVAYQSNLDEVRSAILEYGRRACKVQFDPAGHDRDLVELFKTVENHIKFHKEGFLKRLKRLFSGK